MVGQVLVQSVCPVRPAHYILSNNSCFTIFWANIWWCW